MGEEEFQQPKNLQNGDRYWTVWPEYPETGEEEDGDAVAEQISDDDLIREWAWGDNPSFDNLAMKRVRIYTSKEECVKAARKKWGI